MKKIVGLTGVILIACMMISSLFAPANSVENTSATSDYSASQNNGMGESDYIIKAEKGYIVVYKVIIKRAAYFPRSDKSYFHTYITCFPAGDVLS